MDVMRKLLVGLYAAFMFGAGHAAPMLVIDNIGLFPILTGARNVLVDGALYDVDFKRGTCIDLFSGCDDPSDFLFRTPSEAVAAATALSNLVLDGVAGNFDSEPNLTEGCDFPPLTTCAIITPYSGFAGSDCGSQSQELCRAPTTSA